MDKPIRLKGELPILRLLCLFVVGSVFWIGCSSEPKASDEAALPAAFEDYNLILISLDTTRTDSLSCYDPSRLTTPNLDAIAADSALFTNCIAQATGTGPSHRTMFTSHFVHRHKVIENRTPAKSPYTLATLLKRSGWATGAFVGGSTLRPQFGLADGFDRYLSFGGPRRVINRRLEKALPDAKLWIKDHKDQKFFAFIHGYDPHCPYWPPEGQRGKFASWYTGDLDPRNHCGMVDYGPLFETGQLQEDDLRYINDLYEEAVASADVLLGDLFDTLREEDLLDRTIIIFTSDHGESLGEHDWIGHVRMWEEQMQVPFFIRFPEGKFQGKYDLPIQHVDILPTVLQSLGVTPPEGMQGHSLMSYLDGSVDTIAPDRIRLCQFGAYFSVRTDERWKIIYKENTASQEITEHALYDLVEDPGELRNLYGTPEGKDRFDAIYKNYLDWRERTAAEDARFTGTPIEGGVNETISKELDELGYGGGDEDEE